MSSPQGKGGKSTPTGETYYGTVSRVGPKYGFLDCPPVKAKYGDDVFCPAAGMRGLSVGDKVQFEVLVSEQGQPQAGNVRSCGAGKGGGGKPKGGQSFAMATATGETYFGTLSSIGSRFGFIDCKPVMAKYGNDVFAGRAELQGFSVGDRVDFEVMITSQGQPQAANVRPSAQGKGGGNQGKGWQDTGKGGCKGAKGGKSTPTGETYYGIITSLGNKFGFIDCKPVMAKYGDDVFAPAAALQGFNIGDKVEFEVLMSEKGQPQAGNVRPSQGWGRGSKGADGSKAGGKAGGKKREISVTETGETHTGLITAKKEKFGFIECEETMAIYGIDVFCPGAGLRQHQVGDWVTFDLLVNDKGQPQAANVRPVDESFEPPVKRMRTEEAEMGELAGEELLPAPE